MKRICIVRVMVNFDESELLLLKMIKESVVYIKGVKIEYGRRFITILGSFKAKEVIVRSAVKFS